MRLTIKRSALGLICMLCAASVDAAATAQQRQTMDQLQATIERLREDAGTGIWAAEELAAAQAALDTTRHLANRQSAATVDTNLYIAERMIRIAEARALRREAAQRIVELYEQRDELVAALADRAPASVAIDGGTASDH